MTTSIPAKPRPKGAPKIGTEDWCQQALLESLDALWSQAQWTLARLGFEPDLDALSLNNTFGYEPRLLAEFRRARQHDNKPDLVEHCCHTLNMVSLCRQANTAQQPWMMAWFYGRCEPGHVGFFAKMGEKSFVGAREAGKARSKADRDQQLVARYHELRAAFPKLGKVAAMDKAGKELFELNSAASRKAISKALKAVGESK